MRVIRITVKDKEVRVEDEQEEKTILTVDPVLLGRDRFYTFLFDTLRLYLNEIIEL